MEGGGDRDRLGHVDVRQLHPAQPFDRRGKTLNDLVEWIGVGGVKSQLGALKTEKIDLNMATPEVLIQGATEGYGAVLFDVREDTQWLPVFKGPISATGSYALKTTTQSLKDETQAYVTGVYRAVQWMKTASVEDIAKQLDRYSDTMGLAPESIRKALEWYKPVWTYDLVFTKENYDNVNNVARGIKAEKTYPYEEIVDASFLKKAAGAA